MQRNFHSLLVSSRRAREEPTAGFEPPSVLLKIAFGRHSEAEKDLIAPRTGSGGPRLTQGYIRSIRSGI